MLSERGNPVSTPSIPSPKPSGPAPLWRSLTPAPAGPPPGCSSGETLLCLELPLASRVFPHHPWDTPHLPREVGDRLAPGPRQVSAFRLPEHRALCPPVRFFTGNGCSLGLGIQAFLLKREGFPDSVSSSPLLSGNTPLAPLPSTPPTVPGLVRSALFLGRVSLAGGSGVCSACLILLRCSWVISLSLATGSCCRA